MKSFQVTTLFNKPGQYAEMRASFEAAGFVEERCEFIAFDNAAGNAHEPYSAFARAGRESRARWLVYCHQDILLDRGHGYDRLVEALMELEEKHPDWAVAGVAGVNAKQEMIACVYDKPQTLWWRGELPRPVVLLDEVFFVVNGKGHARWSPELSGFHCYGADVCFHAIARGSSAHVIDFQLTHAGSGRVAPQLEVQHDALVAHWSRHARLCQGISMMGLPLILTKSSLLRRLVAWPALQLRLRRPRWRRILVRLLPAISPRRLRS